MKITVNVWSKSRGNQFWFELSRASSYRGFDLPGDNCSSRAKSNRSHGKSELQMFSFIPGRHVSVPRKDTNILTGVRANNHPNFLFHGPSYFWRSPCYAAEFVHIYIELLSLRVLCLLLNCWRTHVSAFISSWSSLCLPLAVLWLKFLLPWTRELWLPI